jgi:DNA polymerase-3 subunit beta
MAAPAQVAVQKTVVVPAPKLVPAAKKVEAKVEAKLMELIFEQETLLTELSAVVRVAETKKTVPILTHLLFEAGKDGTVTITASDLKQTLRTEFAADVKVAGAVAIPALKFFNYIRLLPKGRVSVKLLENDHIQIRSGRSNTRIPSRAPSEFPATPSPAKETIRLSSRGVRTLLRQSLFAVANTEARFLFNAALFVLHVDRMAMVATDGNRLSHVEVLEEDVLFDGTLKTLLPKDCMADLLSLLNASKDESIEFSQDETNIYFRVGSRQLTARKLIGQFPQYELILPRDNTNFTIVRAVDLMTSVQRVLEFAEERSSGVKMHLSANAMTISASSKDCGESEDTLPVIYAFPPVTIAFNGNYLVEFLKTIGAEGEVRLSLKDSKSAAMIKPERMNSDFDQCYVVMPMRL